ncbi:hypothetical protein FRC08_004471 [Ceratobasidium sp. 394]|nr:hypothetical protein FRC08_004471 [Ceratobasidium sp. 394]
MFEELKKGLRRIKDSARSRSRSRATTPTPAQSQGIGSATPAATSSTARPPPSPLPVPTNIPTVVVSLDPESWGNAQNPDPALILATPSAGEQNTGGTTRTGFKTLLQVLKRSSEAFGPLKEAVEGLSGCIDIVEQEAKTREDYKKLRGELEVIFNDLSGYLGGSAPPTVTPVIESISKSIKREVDIILQKEQRNKLERIAEAMQDTDEVLECYRRIQMLLGRLTVNANMNMWKKIDEQTTKLRLGKLPNAPTAMYRSTESDNLRRVGCTPNTRVDVLEQLQTWAADPTSEKVYWLNGMAGTGKTTVAYSLCEDLRRSRRLGAKVGAVNS